MEGIVHMKIKPKLLIMFTILLVIPGIVVSYFGFQNTKNSVDELTEKGLKGNVELAFELIEAYNLAVESGAITIDEAQEEVKRQLIGEKQSDNTRKLTGKFQLGENGYFVIFDDQGNTIGHPTIEGENVWDEQYNGVYFIQEMIKQAQNGGGLTYYNFPLPNDPNAVRGKVTYTEQSPHWGWIIGVNLYEHEYSTESSYLIITTIITLVVTVLIGLFFGNFFANHLSRPLNIIMERANEIANGNLQLDEIKLNTKDEISVLAVSINTMMNNLRNLIHQIIEVAQKIGDDSSQLVQSSEEVKLGSEQIAATMQELSTGTETEAQLAMELANSMGVFGAKMEAVNDSGIKLRRGFSETLQLTDEGQDVMETSVNQMKSINKIMQLTVEEVQNLEQESEKISELVSVIQDISEQTNLLALNAAIEAARAGDHGKGFAVVADEVRKLAEEVADSVTDITNIVNGIQKETSTVTNALEEGYKEVETGTQSIIETGDTFDGIANAVNEMVRNIEEATDNLADISKESEEMNKMIEDIAAISEQSAAGIEETTASAEESSNAMGEFTTFANDLAVLAKELNAAIQRFRI